MKKYNRLGYFIGSDVHLRAQLVYDNLEVETNFVTDPGGAAEAGAFLNKDRLPRTKIEPGNVRIDGYDGTCTLELSGNAGGSTASEPKLTLNRQGANGADGDRAGTIIFECPRDDSTTGQAITALHSSWSDVSEQYGRTILGVHAGSGAGVRYAPIPGLENLAGTVIEGVATAVGQVDVLLAKGAASTTTVAGDLSITTGLILDSVDITTIQTASESFADNDTSLMTSAAIDDRINAAVSGTFVDLTSEVSGILPVANGGTGASSLTDNKLLTGTGTSAVTAEANATYDGTDLTLTSGTSAKPILSIENTHNDGNSGELKLIGRRSADASVIAANGDDTGKITFVGENNKSGPDPETITYSQILGETSSTVDGAEMGKLSMTVAKSGSLVNLFNGYAGGTGTVATFGDGGLLGSTTFDSTITAFQSTTSTGPIMSIVNGTNDATGPSLSFYNSRGGTGPGGAANQNDDDLGTLKWIGYDSGAVATTFAQILGEANEVTAGSEEGKLTLSVASHDAEMQPGLMIVSGNVEDEVDVTIGNGSASVVTVPGFISIGGHAINDIDVAGEFVDSDEHLMTAAAINDQFGGGGGGVTADPFSTTVIKILPHQFICNDDVGRPAMIEDDTSNTLGVRAAHTSMELYAFQKLPSGYKATHVQVHASASTSSAVTARSFNYQTGADNNVSETSGDFNSNIDITDIPSSATQDLVIKVAPASTSTIIYGATVTIATI